VGPSSALGDYLRARRALVRPEDVGLRTSGRRRVPGLRREELAMLAGISPDYYLRLEQGRGHTPSAQVLDALANALKLDDPATAHLHAISRSSAPAGPDSPERAPHSVELLLASWPTTPAFVHGRRLDVLAANAAASALVPGVLTPGVNLVRAMFLDPSVRTLFDDWERVAASAVARLRGVVGADVDDPQLRTLVDELSGSSEDFRRLWERHDVGVVVLPTRTLHHPLVGRIDLLIETFSITSADGQLLVVDHAEPGSPSERALSRLSRLAGSVA
jgi:transcriptional regulator with XRE-family HTH domain